MKHNHTKDISHFVHFYYGTASLFNPLEKYISDGLHDGETCIIIADRKHRAVLERRLDRDLDLNHLGERGQYLVFDAAEMLKSFMRNGTPDEAGFRQYIGSIMAQVAERGKPIRAFSEMVALVRKKGSDEAVLKLEKLWDELVETYSIALFCAYPSYYFDDTYKNTIILSRIKHVHSAVIP